MPVVTALQKFLGVSDSVSTIEKRSASINSQSEYWTIEDILLSTTTHLGTFSLLTSNLTTTRIECAEFNQRVGAALATAPATAGAAGTIGEFRMTADYIYVCTATNTWKRSALSTWV